MTVPVSIQGLGTVYVQPEYTNSNVQSQYNTYINTIEGIANSPSSPTVTDAANYNAAIAGLISLAQTSNPPITFAMANAINGLVQMTSAINPSGVLSTASSADVINWKNLIVQGTGVLQTSIADGNQLSQTSLQSYIQLDYINSGNNLLNAQLTQLQQAIEANQSAVTLLSSLQQLKNGVLTGAQGTAIVGSNGVVVSFLKIETRNYSNASAWNAGSGFASLVSGHSKHVSLGVSLPGQYSNATSSELGQRLMIQIQGSSSIVDTVEAEGQALVAQIQPLINTLQQVNYTDPTSPAYNESLQGQLQMILTQMTQGGVNGNTPNATKDPILQWVLDNYNNQAITLPDGSTLASTDFNVASSGSYQLALNNAVTTAQSVNSALNVQLGNTFFVFTEFYDSANQTLGTVNDIIKGIDRNMARQ